MHPTLRHLVSLVILAGVAVTVAAASAAGAAAAQPLPQTAYASQHLAGAPDPLFASHEPLELTLIADFAQLDDDRDEENPERPARLLTRATDGTPVEIPLEVRTRGNFRLRKSTCSFPNLRLDFSLAPAAANTVFANQDALKLVAHCRDGGEYGQNLLEEYLVYRLYNLLTEESFQVRLAVITYQDVSGRTETITRYGFLLENVDRLAARLGGLHVEVAGVHPHQLDGEASARVELFEYMIGNTDFSIVNFHNAELVRLPDGTYHPIPYDFDFSGLVDAPYAVPASILGTRSVRERVYRGFCRPGIEFGPIFDSFLANRPAFSQLFHEQPELEPKRAERAVRYLDEFFETAESHRARQALIDRRCRRTVDE